jgi:flagellar biogenesis protein FliO
MINTANDVSKQLAQNAKTFCMRSSVFALLRVNLINFLLYRLIRLMSAKSRDLKRARSIKPASRARVMAIFRT